MCEAFERHLHPARAARGVEHAGDHRARATDERADPALGDQRGLQGDLPGERDLERMTVSGIADQDELAGRVGAALRKLEQISSAQDHR